MCPKMGMGTSVSTAVSERTAVVIEDYMFDASTAGELKPEESPKDFHDTWDLDGTDFTPEASPDDEGYWDDFENIVLNGNYEELGSELVTNGNFATDSDWTKEAGWSISDNKANFNTTGNSTIQQNLSVTTGKTYRIQITGQITSGQLKLAAGSGLSDDSIFTLPLDTYYTHDGGTNDIQIRTVGASQGYLDSVSVKQVDPNDRWQLSSSGNSSSSITDKLTISIDNGDFASARQALSLSNGNTYELSFDLTSDNSSKSIAIRDDDGAAGGLTETISLNFTGTQTKSFIFTANANSDAFFTKRQTASGTYTYSIDNVILKEYAITPLDV